jgi:ATP-binding cassette, subfamily C (CFTR/MRP), member 1
MVIPFLVAVLYLVQNVYLKTSRQMRLLDLEAKSPVFSHFISSFSGLITIRAFNWTSEVHDENLRYLDDCQRPFYLLFMLQRWLSLVLSLITAGLAITLITITVVMRDKIDPGLLGVALVSVMTFGQILGYLLTYWANLEMSLGAVTRITQFEAQTPQEKDGSETPPADWPERGSISVSNVSAYYDDHRVLSDVNLDITPGEKVAICGRTGSGKSTLVALLLRLHEPSNGTIKVDGVDISHIPLRTLRKQLVALPQDPLFLSGTVRQNLDPFEMSKDNTIWECIQKTGLKELIEDKGGLDADLNTDWLSAGRELF